MIKKPWMTPPGVGRTGDYPHGKLGPDDKGGLNVALTRHIAPDGEVMVRFDFGEPVVWLSLPRKRAIEFARMILKHAREGDA